MLGAAAVACPGLRPCWVALPAGGWEVTALMPTLFTWVMPSCPRGLQRAVLQFHRGWHGRLAEGQCGQWVRARNLSLPQGFLCVPGWVLGTGRGFGLNQAFFT